MNQVNIIGRITKDIELKYTQSQQAYARFTVAINKGKDRNGEDMGADFIPVVAWGKNAENCDRFLRKGSLVGVEGNLRSGRFEKDGKAVNTLDVWATRVEFLSDFGEKKEQSSFLDAIEADDIQF